MNVELGTLEKIGLNVNEARIYLALLELGPTLAGRIAEKSKVNRRTVYDALGSLIDKGLAGFIIEANRKVFQATDPTKFLEIIKEYENEFEGLLPHLIARQKLSKKGQEAIIYRGKKGIKTIFGDVLKFKENLVFGSHGRFREALGPFFEQYQRRKGKRRIRTKLLLSERLRNSEIVKLTPGAHRFLKKEYDSPVSTIIYGNKVAMIVWSEEPIGIMITGDEVSKSFRNYFDIMWCIGKK